MQGSLGPVHKSGALGQVGRVHTVTPELGQMSFVRMQLLGATSDTESVDGAMGSAFHWETLAAGEALGTTSNFFLATVVIGDRRQTSDPTASEALGKSLTLCGLSFPI